MDEVARLRPLILSQTLLVFRRMVVEKQELALIAPRGCARGRLAEFRLVGPQPSRSW